MWALALETTLYFVCCLTEGLLNRPIDSHAIKEEMGGNEDIWHQNEEAPVSYSYFIAIQISGQRSTEGDQDGLQK